MENKETFLIDKDGCYKHKPYRVVLASMLKAMDFDVSDSNRGSSNLTLNGTHVYVNSSDSQIRIQSGSYDPKSIAIITRGRVHDSKSLKKLKAKIDLVIDEVIRHGKIKEDRKNRSKQIRSLIEPILNGLKLNAYSQTIESGEYPDWWEFTFSWPEFEIGTIKISTQSSGSYGVLMAKIEKSKDLLSNAKSEFDRIKSAL